MWLARRDGEGYVFGLVGSRKRRNASLELVEETTKGISEKLINICLKEKGKTVGASTQLFPIDMQRESS